MRFMIFRKADAQTEAGLLPSTDLLTAMTAYNESLSRAGVLLAGEGLKPSAEGVRYHYTGGEATVTDGPFAETKELVAGFTTIQARSLDEAVAWARRWPAEDGDVTLEVRQVHEPVPSFGTPDPARRQFIAIWSAPPQAETQTEPSAEMQQAMGQLMADTAAAGVLLEAGGLLPSAVGARVVFEDGTPTVVDGPFSESKEVIGGYAVYQADSLEALRPWSERFGRVVGDGTSEIRPVYGAEDFGEAFTPELQAQEDRLRAEAAARTQTD
ncbi:hypothetical protein B1759_14425 [Rubrivirga sp. SAORIC476]|uniref:YciI family protein n=1 Tax=Rubrivirga sp. SAORIC476 TaxID=1961794 RepID=UPI000BC5797E|nr:YciI family protein [Rubrivirga sp. SAORIC476]PAP79516.1 hypothetical protein B1759_14425 [Rubrivirga sp. SAORIC476]